MIIEWVVVYQSEQNDHRRDQRACALYLCYAIPSVRLGLRLLWTLCFFTKQWLNRTTRNRFLKALVLLVLLVNDSEYSRLAGAKLILSLSCVYFVSPGALRVRPHPTPPPLFGGGKVPKSPKKK